MTSWRVSRSDESPDAAHVPAFALLTALLSAALMFFASPRPADAASPPASPAATAVPQKIPSPASAPSEMLVLADVLAKAAEYCRKLESSAFDFVCREEISEIIDPKLDASQKKRPKPDAYWTNPGSSSYLGPTIVISTVKKIKRSFVYDYQCIRAGRTIRESRTQLEENGKKKVRENAELQTSVIVYGTALLAPVGLLGERFQPDYDFKVVAVEVSDSAKLLVLDASPKPGVPQSRNLYGKVWIDPATGNIHRVEWSDSRVGNFDAFQKRGEAFKRTPHLTIRSDFSAEKNGIRFPSRLYVEEAYLNDKGKAFIRSKTDIAYKDFKFFSVEYEIRD